jgi:hypothetical protein
MNIYKNKNDLKKIHLEIILKMNLTLMKRNFSEYKETMLRD